MKKIFFCLFVFFTSSTNAAIITGDATGTDNFSTTDFWGISYGGGSGFINSVTLDLSPFTNGLFDFNGSTSFHNSFAPVIGALNGLQNSDITASFIGTLPTELTFDFALNSFQAGDSFRFSADTDNTGLSGNNLAGLLFSVTMEDGSLGNGVFSLTNIANQSASTVDISPSTVPVPAAIWLLGSGLIGFIGMRRKSSKLLTISASS